MTAAAAPSAVARQGALAGKVALVTGGASGIGRAAALLFAEEGARVVVADLDEQAGGETVAAIAGAGGEACFQPLDVRDEHACARVVEVALQRFAALDAAFNSAGVSGRFSLTGDMTLDAWQQVLDVNLTGVFRCMRPQLAAMKGRGGAIVNTASIAGTGGAAGAAAYSAAKHGVVGLTLTAALEYAKYGVRVNAISPGYVQTPMTVGDRSAFDAARLAQAVQQTPMRRMARAREIAEMALWLCSDRASFVTGVNYVVDGGATTSGM